MKKMNNNKQNINKKYYFRLRRYEISENNSINNSKIKNITLKREFDYQYLKDYDKMMENFVNLIKEIRKKDIEDRIPIIVLNHSEINEIYIYTKEQWDLYFKFNIIQECFNNNVLKAEYILAPKEEMQKTYKLIENKKEIIKYIIKNIPLKMHLNIILSFLNGNMEICKKYEKYFLDKILNCDVNQLNNLFENEIKNDNDEILESNININNIKNEFNFEAKKENKIHFDEEYYIHREEFIQILDKQFKIFSKYKKSLDRINEILEEKENIFLQDSENNIHNTSIIFQKDTSFNNIGLNDNNIDKDVGLNSMLNPPKEFVKDLLDEDEKFFKQMSEKEYYDGLTQYKDQLYRDFIQKFLKNN